MGIYFHFVQTKLCAVLAKNEIKSNNSISIIQGVKMVQYNIPDDVIAKFCQKAGENRKIETLGYLVGFKNCDIITVTDFVFPRQRGTGTFVDDEGMDGWAEGNLRWGPLIYKKNCFCFKFSNFYSINPEKIGSPRDTRGPQFRPPPHGHGY